MFGAFALDVSNFQAGSFGTPAFFLALFGDALSDPCTRRPMEMNRAVIRGGLQAEPLCATCSKKSSVISVAAKRSAGMTRAKE
jgi:hypothetical protein